LRRLLNGGLLRTLCVLLSFSLSGVAWALATEPAASQDTAPRGTFAFPQTLTVGVLASGWPPFEEFDQGRLSGLSVDYLRALAGPDVAFDIQTFPDMPHLLAAACANQVDHVMSIAHARARTLPRLLRSVFRSIDLGRRTRR
jgi:ABC-type amino acid transport substrate-binding protein